MEKEELELRFTYHKPDAESVTRMEELRFRAKLFVELISTLVPESREQSLAITAVEEAVMWANAGIARRQTKVD